jgi:hypothetical protein
MFPLWFALLGGSFVFLDVGPSILFLVFPHLFFGEALWFIYDQQGFIKLYIFLGDGCQLWFLWVCCDLVIASDSGKEKCFCFDALGTKTWDSLLGPPCNHFHMCIEG